MSDFMKWRLSDLAVDNGKKMPYKNEIKPDINQFDSVERLKAIDSFTLEGVWYYDEVNDHLYNEMKLRGYATVADSITLEDTRLYLEIEATEVFGFNELDDVADHLVEGDQIDLEPIINQLIVANIPFKINKKDRVYPKGEDWEVISEEDFKKEPKPINPQMAKLLKLDIDDE